MAAIVEIKYFNSFFLKKVENNRTLGSSPTQDPAWPGLDWNPFGQPDFPIDAAPAATTISDSYYYIEESRIKGGFNNDSVALGVRAYLNEESPDQDSRQSSLIYSGVYNSRTDVNNTNVFSVAEPITKSLDPAYGSIQKLYAEDTNLTIFQEDKVSQALIDKDAIYSAEGQGQAVSTQNLVIGQIVPYLGRYGIGKNPESFAQFGFRKYFVDPVRTTVMRLSRDGLTEISEYGMKDFFRDNLNAFDSNYKTTFIEWEYPEPEPSPNPVSTFDISNIDACSIYLGSKIYNISGNSIIDQNTVVTDIEELATSPVTYRITVSVPFVPTPTGYFSFDYKSRILGGWDNYNRYYTLSLQPTPTIVNKWTDYSTLSYDEGVRGWTSFFTYKPSFIFSVKGVNFTTIDSSIYRHYTDTDDGNYGIFYGQQNPSNVTFIVNPTPSMKKVFQTVNYEGDNGWYVEIANTNVTRENENPNNNSLDNIAVIYSYKEGLYTDPNSGYPMRAGFNRKENLYTANIINNSLFQNNQVLPSNAMSGVKGYTLQVKISTDSTTDPNGSKELWSVGTKYIQSS